MPFPCNATTLLFWKRPVKATAQRDMGTAWYVWISMGRPETECGRPARVRLLPATTRSSTKVVTRTRLADRMFPSTTRTLRHYRRLAGSRHGMCELTRQRNGMGTTWYVWISLKLEDPSRYKISVAVYMTPSFLWVVTHCVSVLVCRLFPWRCDRWAFLRSRYTVTNIRCVTTCNNLVKVQHVQVVNLTCLL
jgi:hypothetical protein